MGSTRRGETVQSHGNYRNPTAISLQCAARGSRLESKCNADVASELPELARRVAKPECAQ